MDVISSKLIVTEKSHGEKLKTNDPGFSADNVELTNIRTQGYVCRKIQTKNVYLEGELIKRNAYFKLTKEANWR